MIMVYKRYKIKKEDLREVGTVRVRNRFLSKEEGLIYYCDYAPILIAKVDDGFVAYCNGKCVWGCNQDRAIKSIKNLLQTQYGRDKRGFIFVGLDFID